MTRVFLGGTCNGSQWREQLKPLLRIEYFDPVVDDWNEEAQRRELEERERCDFVLYVITPLMKGFYSIAEVVDDSNKRPEKTVFAWLPSDGRHRFDVQQMKSLRAVDQLVLRNGARVCLSLDEVAAVLNDEVEAHRDDGR